MTGVEDVEVFIWEKVLLKNSLSQKEAQAIFEPNLSPYKYSSVLKNNHSSHLPAYEDGTDRVF